MAAPKGNKHAVGNPGGGRPTSYKPEYAEWAVKLCRLGATDEDLARSFDVSETTINAWKLKHVEFYEALKQGKDLADAEVADKLFKRATGYSHDAVKIVANATTKDEHVVHYTEHYPPDTTACIFWLKNRQSAKWRDKIEQDVKHSGNVVVQASDLDESI
jgi:hypothetical protein